jgi:hypothetical protein
MSYTDLIAQEQAKIALLQAKIDECLRRIETLRSFENADELDSLLAKSLFPSPLPGPRTSSTTSELQSEQRRIEPKHVSNNDGHSNPKRRLSEDVVGILRFVGLNGRSLDELEAYCASRGYEHNRGSLRSVMSNYKIKHGFIDSPKSGFFRLTDRALAFLNANYPVVMPVSEAPSVSAEGASDTTTQAALPGGTESDDEL